MSKGGASAAVVAPAVSAGVAGGVPTNVPVMFWSWAVDPGALAASSKTATARHSISCPLDCFMLCVQLMLRVLHFECDQVSSGAENSLVRVHERMRLIKGWQLSVKLESVDVCTIKLREWQH